MLIAEPLRWIARDRPGPHGALPALLVLYVCWGSSVPAMKLMVGSIPPLLGAGAVFLSAGVVLLAIAGPRRGDLRRPEVLRAGRVGLLLLAGGQGLATVSLTYLTASLMAIIVATVPLTIALVGALSGERLDRATAASLVVGFAGVALALLTAPSATLGGTLLGVLLCLAATGFWAAGSLASRSGAVPRDARVNGGVQLVAGGAALLLGSAVTGELAGGLAPSAESLLAAGFLLLADSTAGFLLYAHLLRSAPIALVSTYAYATPVLSAALGFVVLDEPFWIGAVAGGAIVIGAIAAQIHGVRPPAAPRL